MTPNTYRIQEDPQAPRDVAMTDGKRLGKSKEKKANPAVIKKLRGDLETANELLGHYTEENERVRQANLYVMDLFHQMKDELERANKRIAMLEEKLERKK